MKRRMEDSTGSSDDSSVAAEADAQPATKRARTKAGARKTRGKGEESGDDEDPVRLCLSSCRTLPEGAFRVPAGRSLEARPQQAGGGQVPQQEEEAHRPADAQDGRARGSRQGAD